MYNNFLFHQTHTQLLAFFHIFSPLFLIVTLIDKGA